MLHHNRRSLFTALIVALSVAASLLVIWDGLRPCSTVAATEFQQLVGGLGMGPAVDLSRCAFGFDPRLWPDCAWNVEPIPGGRCFCPQHPCSVLPYPPLVPSTRRPEEGHNDGPLP